MVKVNEYDKVGFLLRTLNCFNKITQLSYVIMQSKERYPQIKDMTPEQAEELTRILLALGNDVAQVYQDWKKLYAEYQK